MESEGCGQMLKTNVWHGDRCWFVSTINRRASYGYGSIYAETMVWECDPKTYERGRFVWQGEGARDSITAHMFAVRELATKGEIKEVENDDV